MYFKYNNKNYLKYYNYNLIDIDFLSKFHKLNNEELDNVYK